MTVTDDDSRKALLRRGFALEYTTLGWNVVGIVVLAIAAISARSVALAGFGLDSLIEIGASTVVIWELSGTGQQRQRRALRLIGYAFIALALYLLVQSTLVLAVGYHPRPSPLGIAWTALTAALMFTLAAATPAGHHRGAPASGSFPRPQPILHSRYHRFMSMLAEDAQASRVDLAPAAALFHSLADPARLAIVQRLADGPARVVDLTAQLGLAQSTVSKHLACLRECGLVGAHPAGRASVYSLAQPALAELLAAAEALLAATGNAIALCPAYGQGR